MKQVMITNISPQAITLPVASPEALLVIEVGETNDQGEQKSRQFFIDNKSGSLLMNPGQQVSIRDVKWWEVLRGLPIKPDSYYRVNFLARSPKLWDVPTHLIWSWAHKGDKILKALEISKGKSE